MLGDHRLAEGGEAHQHPLRQRHSPGASPAVLGPPILHRIVPPRVPERPPAQPLPRQLEAAQTVQRKQHQLRPRNRRQRMKTTIPRRSLVLQRVSWFLGCKGEATSSSDIRTSQRPPCAPVATASTSIDVHPSISSSGNGTDFVSWPPDVCPPCMPPPRATEPCSGCPETPHLADTASAITGAGAVGGDGADGNATRHTCVGSAT